jgi:hypothetical protein
LIDSYGSKFGLPVPIVVGANEVNTPISFDGSNCSKAGLAIVLPAPNLITLFSACSNETFKLGNM